MQFTFIKKQFKFFILALLIIVLFLLYLGYKKSVFPFNSTPIHRQLNIFSKVIEWRAKAPLVSVVMPTYNRAELLPRAIESILNQTMKDFEFIIVDDGSTDNTPQLLQAYQQKDPRIKVITLRQNKGVASARNVGNQAAKGKYITVMDSDDIALPLLLQKTSSFLEKNPAVTIVRPPALHYNDGTDPYKQNYKRHFPVYQIFWGNTWGNVAITFRNDFIKKHQIVMNLAYSCAEDYDFWIKMIKAGARMRKLPDSEPLFIIRSHNAHYTDFGSNSYAIVEGFKNFLKIPAEKRNNACFVFKTAIHFNRFLFDQKTIQEGVKAICPPSSGFYINVNHPGWFDYFIFSDDWKRIFRYSLPNEKASVLSFIPQKEITVKWDRWGKETFYFSSHNTYQFKNRK